MEKLSGETVDKNECAGTELPSLPFVSVVVPMRNEARFIRHTLGSALAQDYPAERFEVLVSDGRSTDDTRQIIAELQAAHPNLHLIDNPGKIVATGLNAAIAQARGDVIVRVDGHTIIANDYVRQCVAALQRSGADNVGGRMVAVAEGWFGKAVARATSSPFGVGGARFHYSEREEYVDTVYLGAWWRETFDRIGLFDEEQVRDQDDEFNYRLRAKGGKILLSPAIRSQYYNRSTPRSLARQYFQYGYWKVRVLQKHPRQMRPRQFVPPAFVAALLISLFLLPFTPLSWWLLLGFLGSYAATNLGASAWVARNEGWRPFPLLPVAFATVHVSYGLGFLLGLVKFWNRWREGDNTPGNRPWLTSDEEPQ
jgi:glycosyltransferase involved in cell wall biosynthesis